jgi:hypothetical protein
VISVIVVNPDRLNIAFMIHFTNYLLYYLYYEDISKEAHDQVKTCKYLSMNYERRECMLRGI